MGARLVQDINPEGSSSPNELISLNGFLFFSAELGDGSSAEETNGNNDNSSDSTDTDGNDSTSETTDDSESIEGTSQNKTVGLIRSDGSEGGTKILRSFNSVTNLVSTGDQLFFIAGIDNQYQLWTSDGTVRGTQQVKDLYPNADLNFPQDLFEIDGVLFYSAIDNNEDIESGDEGGIGKYPYVNGYEVWRREGEGVGSRFFRNLIPDRIITDIEISDGDGGSLILDDSGQPVQLKKTTTVETTIGASGTTTKTTVEEERFINGQIVNTTISNSQTTPTVATDTASKTVNEEIVLASEIANTAEITTTVFENDSFPRDFTGINGNYFFIADSSSFYSLETRQSDVLIGGQELWFSDGTEAGTHPININQNTYSFYEPEDGEYTPSTQLVETDFGFIEQSSSSFPRELTPAKNELYFVANDGVNGFELWSIGDQGKNLSLISDLNKGSTSSSPKDLTIIGKNLYFSADNGSGRKLFRYTKSLSKPEIVRNSGSNPEGLTAVGNKLYYSAESELGRELWSAKKSQASIIKDINPGSESSSPDNFTTTKRISVNHSKRTKNKYLYFTADDGSHGKELMSLKLNGKGNRIQLESDIINGPSSSNPRDLTLHDQRLFFTANNRSNGRELWTVGPSIQGPSGESGAASTKALVSENKTFVYQFSNNPSEETTWKINGGTDSSLFKINTKSGALAFKSAPDYEKPDDQNKDNVYEVFVRSIASNSGYKSDQMVQVRVINKNEKSDPQINDPSDEILYYTEACGAMTANGPLNPCDVTNPGSGSIPNTGSGSSSGSIPTVRGNSELTSDGKSNYNSYNSAIDDYNNEDIIDPCDWADVAKIVADSQLTFENDPTLAQHFNRYFASACNLSNLII